MARQSLKLQIYKALKKKIVTCEYPPGMVLNEDFICSEFNVSRTPVRDALSRLEQEGLLSIHSKRGIVINTVSLRSVNEIFEMRLRIEPYAVLTYGIRQSESVYADFTRRFLEVIEQPPKLYDLDDQFHRSFIQAADNRYLTMVYDMISAQSSRHRILSGAYDRLEATQKEHYEIAANCLRRNWREAARSMTSHIEMSRNSIIDFVLHEKLDSDNIFESS